MLRSVQATSSSTPALARAGAGRGDPVPAAELHRADGHDHRTTRATSAPRPGCRCGSGRSTTSRSTRSAAGSTPISATASPTRRARPSARPTTRRSSTTRSPTRRAPITRPTSRCSASRAGRACACGCCCTGSACGRWNGSAGASRKRERTARKTWQWGLATALQQSQIVYLVGALFVGIAYQPFIFMLVGLQCALWSYVQRTEDVPSKARFKRPSGEQALPAAS